VKRAKALPKYETSRNLGDELLAAAREIRARKAARVHNIKVPEILEVRMRAGLSQQKFADVLGVSTPDARVNRSRELFSKESVSKYTYSYGKYIF
jgi:hypothetical protein